MLQRGAIVDDHRGAGPSRGGRHRGARRQQVAARHRLGADLEEARARVEAGVGERGQPPACAGADIGVANDIQT